jgi:hypothetical protein
MTRSTGLGSDCGTLRKSKQRPGSLTSTDGRDALSKLLICHPHSHKVVDVWQSFLDCEGDRVFGVVTSNTTLLGIDGFAGRIVWPARTVAALTADISHGRAVVTSLESSW